MIITSEAPLPAVEKPVGDARNNNILAELINEQQLWEIEPLIASGLAAVHCPFTFVLDGSAVLQRIKDRLEQYGVTFFFNRAFQGHKGKGCRHTAQGEIRYGFLINCDGAYADTMGKEYGLANEFALVPIKGIYWKLRIAANPKVRANIYPVPDFSMPFLDVHLILVISGDVYFGPTANPAFGLENYGIMQEIGLAESAVIGYQLAGVYSLNENNLRKLAHVEMGKCSKQNFLAAARKVMPSLTEDDMVPIPKAGIRPQLINAKTRKLEIDYILTNTEDSLLLQKRLPEAGGGVDVYYWRPHHPDFGPSSNCRKTALEKLLRAAKDLNIDLPASLMVGDKSIDVEAGLAMGVCSLLVQAGYGEKDKHRVETNIPVFASLVQAAVHVKNQAFMTENCAG